MTSLGVGPNVACSSKRAASVELIPAAEAGGVTVGLDEVDAVLVDIGGVVEAGRWCVPGTAAAAAPGDRTGGDEDAAGEFMEPKLRRAINLNIHDLL